MENDKDKMPTHKELLAAYHNKLATLPINGINHREFVMDGVRYFCGFNSAVSEVWPQPDWLVYRKEVEA